jgi:hypothetical protein
MSALRFQLILVKAMALLLADIGMHGVYVDPCVD